MRIKSLRLKYRKRDVVIKTALSSLNVYFILINYSNNLDFLLFSLFFNNFIKKLAI